MNKFFYEEDPDRRVSKEQMRFMKLLVENRDFFFKFNLYLDQNWLNPPELRHIARAIKELHRAGQPVTYDALSSTIVGHYDMSREDQQISWLICEAVLKECKELDYPDGWEKIFLSRLDELLAQRYTGKLI